MEKLVDEGLVKSIGISNYNSVQTQEILDNSRIKPVVNQVSWKFMKETLVRTITNRASYQI